MKDWKIFQGNGHKKPKAIEHLPPPPRWRQFSSDKTSSAVSKERLGATFQTPPEAVELVNAALYLRRPLLVTGKPGTGKTSLVYAVAKELDLGEVLRWSITTRTTLKNGLYDYDAIGRLQETQRILQKAQLDGKRVDIDQAVDIGQFLRLGPLGTALLPSKRPRVLLIDEIDKSDIDLPNDLLNVFEEGEFEIPELVRLKQTVEEVTVRTAYTDDTEAMTRADLSTNIKGGRVPCETFPFIVMTSNGKRDFPPPFLRRCLRLDMREPQEDALESIVTAHLDELTDEAKDLIHDFLARRDGTSGKRGGDLATDQLLNAIYLVTRNQAPQGEEKQRLIDRLLKYLSSSEDA
ncbi:MAG: MoxR family ATPase [Cyanobacteria bacterium J06638_22]